MPRDKNDNPLAQGDVVNIRARITRVDVGDEFIALETIESVSPDRSAKSSLILHGKQVERVTGQEDQAV